MKQNTKETRSRWLYSFCQPAEVKMKEGKLTWSGLCCEQSGCPDKGVVFWKGKLESGHQGSWCHGVQIRLKGLVKYFLPERAKVLTVILLQLNREKTGLLNYIHTTCSSALPGCYPRSSGEPTV